ncbi:kinesin-like protein subito [Teleopsis dalmanni]|uniref:kinesin-like protein subito n=1 Tax=Teleopsis dalmanni TaxID=139649 RepID=UPI0018CE42F3|nr:kinesin-like protein subito [Teleopsis dalmanni]
MSRNEDTTKRNVLSFINGREPSIDRRFRPCPKNIFKAIDIDNIDELDDDSNSNFDDASTVSGDISKTSTIGEDGAMVYLRLRPVNSPSSSYKIAGNGNTLVVNPRLDQTTTSNNKAAMEKHFTFSAIFDNNDSQKGVYNKCIGDKIKLEESFTVLTYGTSGSGKTFTLLGDDVNPGIVPRSIENIFTLYNSNIYPHPAVKLQNARVVILDDELLAKEIISTRQVLTACGDITSVHKQLQQIICSDHNFETTVFDDVSVMIWVSFVEIYNEFVYDLLELSASNQTITVPSRKNLKIVSNDGKVFVKGLTQVYVKNSLEALKLLRFGLQRVTYASTSINSNSSRSHCIFIIDVLKYNASGLITEISYKFCDLAGSERLDKTGNVGSRLKEAQRINTSLMILGRCLDAANNLNRKKNTEVIPYRESKLTMLLQAPLLGKEKIAMVVNVTPTEKYYEENLNVLGFSSIAKNIIFKPPIVKQNNSRFSFFLEYSKAGSAQNAYIEQLLEENILLRSDNNRLINEVNNFQIRINSELLRQEKEIRNELVDSFEKTLTATKEQAENRLKQELECQKRVFESKLAKVKRAHIEQIEDLREELQELKEKECQKYPNKLNPTLAFSPRQVQVLQALPEKMRDKSQIKIETIDSIVADPSPIKNDNSHEELQDLKENICDEIPRKRRTLENMGASHEEFLEIERQIYNENPNKVIVLDANYTNKIGEELEKMEEDSSDKNPNELNTLDV